jgi:hypothetical protein
MKQFAAIALLAFASFAATDHALAWDQAVRADVPFNFTAGGTQFPAGTYTIIHDSPQMIRVKGADQQARFVVSSIAAFSEELGDNKLVFHKYGDRYFLREVVNSNSNFDVRLPVSKLEKRVKNEKAD